MRAAICYEFGKPLVIEDGITVDSPAKDEVKVKIAFTAVCHSDLHLIRGEMPFKLPGIAGHEISGHIEEVGEGVTELKPGDPVIVGTVTSGCGRCYYCTVGLRHLCLNRSRPLQGRHVNKKGQRISPMAGPSGGFSEYTTVSQTLVQKIPQDMPLDKASLLACGVSTGFGAVVNRAQVKPFSSVVVLGAGGVGLNVIQGAAYCGAYPIIAIDIQDNKLETAKRFGATHAINSTTKDNVVEEVRKLTPGRGAEFIFVTVGNISALRQGWLMSAPRGMTVIIGIMKGDLSSFTPFEFLSEKVLTGCGGGSLRMSIDIPNLITLYQGGRLKLDELISGRYKLENINEAIDSLEKGEALRNLVVF